MPHWPGQRVIQAVTVIPLLLQMVTVSDFFAIFAPILELNAIMNHLKTVERMKKLMIVALMLTLGMGLAMAQDKKADCPKTKATTACVSKTPCDDCKTQGKHECDSKKDCADKQQCKGEAKHQCEGKKECATAKHECADKKECATAKHDCGDKKDCADKKDCDGKKDCAAMKACDGKKDCTDKKDCAAAKHECKGDGKHQCDKEAAAKKDCCKDK